MCQPFIPSGSRSIHDVSVLLGLWRRQIAAESRLALLQACQFIWRSLQRTPNIRTCTIFLTFIKWKVHGDLRIHKINMRWRRHCKMTSGHSINLTLYRDSLGESEAKEPKSDRLSDLVTLANLAWPRQAEYLGAGRDGTSSESPIKIPSCT